MKINKKCIFVLICFVLDFKSVKSCDCGCVGGDFSNSDDSFSSLSSADFSQSSNLFSSAPATPDCDFIVRPKDVPRPSPLLVPTVTYQPAVQAQPQQVSTINNSYRCRRPLIRPTLYQQQIRQHQMQQKQQQQHYYNQQHQQHQHCGSGPIIEPYSQYCDESKTPNFLPYLGKPLGRKFGRSHRPSLLQKVLGNQYSCC